MEAVQIVLIGNKELAVYAKKIENLFKREVLYYDFSEWKKRKHLHEVVITNSLDKNELSLIKSSSQVSLGLGSIENSTLYFESGLAFIEENFKFDSLGGLHLFIQLIEDQKMAKKALVYFDHEMNKLNDKLKGQLEKTKALHQKTIPLRFEKFASLECVSKYVVGMATGGEFFDSFEVGKHLFLVGFSSTSYLESASVMKWSAGFKQEKENLSLAELAEELNKSSPEGKLSGELVLIKVNLRDYSYEGMHFGDYELISSSGKTLCFSNDLKVSSYSSEENSFSGQMKRGERLALVSPGFKKNWLKANKTEHYAPFFRESVTKPINEFIHEALYKLYTEGDQGILDDDSSLILMEVSKNAIISI